MRKSMGFWRTWGLVVGATIGSTVFMLPTLLVPLGSIGPVAWIVGGAGMLCMALSLGSLARRIPKIGGPYAYARKTFGDLSGFLTAWCYWVSCWIGIASIAISFSAYVGVFYAPVATDPLAGAVAAITLIWVITTLNLAGVRAASVVNLLMTLLKLLPLIAVGIAGFVVGEFENIPSMNSGGEPLLLFMGGLLVLIIGAFVGMEAGTIPADDVINPRETIPRAMTMGALSICFVYILGTTGVALLVPAVQLVDSTSPFADAAGIVFGRLGSQVIAGGAIISFIGVANATILIAGQISRAAALDGLFPPAFTRLNRKGAPAFALITSALLATILVVASITDGVVAAYRLMLLLGTLTAIVVYIVLAFADLIQQRRDALQGKPQGWCSRLVALAALATVSFAAIGSGLDMIAYTVVLIVVGLPVYYYQKKRLEKGKLALLGKGD